MSLPLQIGLVLLGLSAFIGAQAAFLLGVCLAFDSRPEARPA